MTTEAKRRAGKKHDQKRGSGLRVRGLTQEEIDIVKSLKNSGLTYADIFRKGLEELTK